MGCLESKAGGQLDDEKSDNEPAYSWDQRKNINIEDFTISDKNDETCGRLPGTINGQQFIIRDCNGSDIFIFDNSATVTIDDCVNCNIFIGPVSGSVFFRDCSDCRCIVACQQFRTRDCKKMDFQLICATQPIIEASTSMRFGCYQCFYPDLANQFSKANLGVFSNNWSKIHDFTPVPDETNWSMLLDNWKCLQPPYQSQFEIDGLSYEKSQSIVPLTHGERRKTFSQTVFVLLFHDVKGKAMEIINNITSLESLVLVHTKQMPIIEGDMERIFKIQVPLEITKKGDVIHLEFNCEDGYETIESILKENISDNSNYRVIKGTDEMLDSFHNFSDMQMS